MTRPKPPRLLDMEDGMVVAGTHDVELALRIVVAEHDHFEGFGREMPLSDLPDLVTRLYRLLEFPHREWARVLPAMRGNCPCGEGHAWDASPAKPGSRGSFPIVAWYL